MTRLWTDIVQPTLLPLARMQAFGIRIDEEARVREIGLAEEDKETRSAEVVAIASPFIGGELPAAPKWERCGEHPDYMGVNVVRKCLVCRGIWETIREWRTSKTYKRWQRLSSFNVDSDDHKRWLLFESLKLKPIEYTDHGRPRVNLRTLEALLERKTTPDEYTDLIRTLIQIAHLSTLIDVFLNPPIGPDGRAHPPLTEATSIGRMRSGSSAFDADKPTDELAFNIQNIPDRARHIYIPDDGHLFVEVDASKIEWILMMLHAYSKKARIAYAEGWDVHTMLAEKVASAWGKEWARLARKERKEIRWLTKRGTHGLDYGMLEFKMARVLRISLAQARTIKRFYFDMWPELPRLQQEIEQAAIADMRLTSVFGRYRRFLDITSVQKKGKRVLTLGELNEALAFLPASENGDIWKMRFTALDRAGLVQVTGTHDSHAMQIREDRVDVETRRALEICQEPIAEYAPFNDGEPWSPRYEAKIGRNWGPRIELEDDQGRVIGVKNPNGLWGMGEERHEPAN